MNVRVFLPLLVFLVLFVQGSTLGLSDDEAYYWVLAQTPAWSYAFHPPAIGWMIAGFQFLLQGVWGSHSVALVRLPAACSSALILFLVLRWMDARRWAPALFILSFFAFFSLSWMIVPDLPLFLGWTALFVSVWSVIEKKITAFDLVLLVLGSCCVMLAKYSGILAIASALCALRFWAPQKKAMRWVFAGFACALVPILIWNAQHEWASILYQIRDRHGHDWSWLRLGKFWAIQLGLAGPIVLFALGQWIWSGLRTGKISKLRKYALIWALPPALIYGIEPLLSDFKPHWALIAWWPILLAMGMETSQKLAKGVLLENKIKFQMAYGGVLTLCVLAFCHLPVFISSDLKSNITNDLYGWSELDAAVQKEFSPEEQRLPWVGSRYQTAGQVAFHLGRSDVSFLPRSLKEMDEWPNLHVTDTQGPDWPTLLNPVFFVSDNRYDAPPAFKAASCMHRLRVDGQRAGQIVKWIEVWKCVPGSTL